MACPTCGRAHRRSQNGPCGACYERQRYTNQSEEWKRDYRARIKAYNKEHPAQRKRWVARWRQRTGRANPPDWVALCAALKRLNAAVAQAEKCQRVCGTSQ